MPVPRSDIPVAATRSIAPFRGAGRTLECHLLSFADLPPAAVIRENGPPRSLISRLGRLLLATVLAEHLGVASPADVPLLEGPGGRPVLPGEEPAGARAGLSHDRGVLVVGFHPAGCAVDVEDTPISLIAEVAGRFCAVDERLRLPVGAAVRGLWSAKEAVAKYTGLGLRAGLREITFDGDPQAGWVRSRYPGAVRAPLCRVVALPDRHLAFAVGAGRGSAAGSGIPEPIAVEVHRWVPTAWLTTGHDAHPTSLARVDLAPAGDLTDLARAVPVHRTEPPHRTDPPIYPEPPTCTGREFS
jgi:hypothetical protein